MKMNPWYLFLYGIFSMVFTPVFVKAQTDAQSKENNHCVVKKSPYRLAMDSGKVIYIRQCLPCHQADGLGVSNMNPPLTGKQISGEKNKLIGIVIRGLATHEEIDGIVYENVMPAHPDMKDKEIADVLTYIRNSFGNKASSVKSAEVKSVRTKLK
jgi:mono/diheme cytochrome c family protein